ncbi:MAG: HEAT repeat domain-containing protein [Anaerolineae bacterium]|nr:HEAT repeat domain-containing protein [Anaerolineae bacterium]
MALEYLATTIFIVLAVFVSLAYMVTGFILRREYGRAMVKLLEREDYAALLSQEYEWGAVDTNTLKRLNQRLDEAEDADFVHFFATIMLEVGSDDVIPILIARARDAGGETQRTIMEVLVQGDARGDLARFFYVENAENTDPLTRQTALIGLMNIIGDDEEIRFKIAIDHAHDRDPVVRAEAVKTLTQSESIAHKDTAERVLKAMQSDYFAEARIAAINVMVDMGDVEYIRKLVLFMEDDDDTVRLATTVGIEKLWRDNMPQEITQLILDREKMLLDDPIERIRQAELRVLGKIANASAASTLIRALVDTSPEIRHAAIDALASLGNHAIEPLLKATQAENGQLAKQAMIVLTRINHDRYDDDLIRLAHETLDEIYANHAILQVLDDCQMYPSFGVLTVHFTEQNRTLRAEVFDMLRVVYDETAVNTIHETLQSENPRTRINAVEALESLATPELARQVAPLFDKPDLRSTDTRFL